MSSDKLNVGDFGAAVTNLHGNLKKHGFNVSPEEVKRQFFGPTTREAVGEFQKAHGVDPSCIVCEKTTSLLEISPTAAASSTMVYNAVARPLNADILKSLPVIPTALPPIAQPSLATTPLTSDGRKAMKPIEAPLRPNDTGENVTNLQDALVLLLEKKIWQLPPPDMRFVSPTLLNLLEALRRDRETQSYKEGTALGIRLFRDQYKEQFHLTPGEDVDGPTADALNKLLKESGTFDTPQAEWVIQGRLVDAYGRGLDKYKVSLSEYDLDGTTPIDSYISHPDGTFEFLLKNSEDLRKGDDSTTPDLVFEIFDPAGVKLTILSIMIVDDIAEKEVPRLAESEQAPIVLMNVTANLVLRVVVNLNERLSTEFERLVARLSPFMGQMRFADLKEDAEHFQISFLTRETGIERAKIEQLRDAFQQEHESGNVPAWVFFGLASQALSLTSVASMPQDKLVAVLKSFQPSDDQSNLEEIASKLKQFAEEHGIQTQVTNLKASVGELLQPILGSEEKLNSFLDAYARHEGDTESFWSKISENPDFVTEVPRIQLNLQLSQLTLNNSGLVNALQQQGIKSTRQLADISSQDWEALAIKHKEGIPSHITGEDDSARAKVYAQELQILVELAFPTDVIKKSVQQPEVNTFLSNNPSFDFTSTPVESYLQGQEEQVLKGIENPDVVKNHLRQMQRLYTLTANTADMNVLMDMEYESAHQIAKLSVEDFSQSLAGKISEENAHIYHAKARAVSDASAMVYHQFRELAFSHSFRAANNLSGDFSTAQDISNPAASPNFKAGDDPAGNTNVLPGIPNWESLFGSLDMCECQHCKSVYSPAAYFVDLLHILLGQSNGAPRKELFRRRPDLKYTKLTCEHTETLIPYIDLVNEVLETYVAQSDVGNPAAQQHAEKSTNDTSRLSAEDLAANPQHPNLDSAKDAKDAYQLIKEAIFPLNLPFDMDLETARQFLQEQNSSRFEVMRIFGDAASNGTKAEQLRISEREFEVLTLKKLNGITNAEIINPINGNKQDISVDNLWGNPTVPAGGTLGKVLANVRTFLDNTAIAYIDLISLLNTRFLNPNFPINVYLQELSEDVRTAWLAGHPDEDQLALQIIELAATNKEAPCDLNQTQILHLNGDPLSDEELSRFNRFIRLWKKLGCTIPELDGLLIALGATDITPQVIQDLSALWQVHQDLDLSLEQSAVLAGNMPTAGKDSLFAKLFLNKAILQIDDKFKLNVAQTELENSAELLQNHVPAILAAFQISEENLNRIVDYTKLKLTTDFLTLANLSKIYRYVIFAKGLNIKIQDLLMWLNLTSQTPWGTVAELVSTQELLTKLQRYGFKAADFAYIFNDEKTAGNPLPPNDDIINQSAKTLREGLQKITQENTPKDTNNVTADFLKTKLGICLDPEEAAKIIGILDGTNPQDKSNYLLTPKVLESFKDLLQNYLTAADIAGLEATIEVSERLTKYWGKIEAKLLPVLRETFIQQHLIATFKAEAAQATLVLKDIGIMQTCLDIETDTPAHLKSYSEFYIVMHKFMWLIGQLKLSGKELAYFQNNANFGSFNWKDFNFSVWLRIADFVALRSSLPPAEQDLLSIFEAAKNGGDVVKTIVEVTNWDKKNVAYFFSKHTVADFLNEIALILLQSHIALSTTIGVSIEKLAAWTDDAVTDEQAQDIKRTLKAKYDETAWIDVSTQVHNRLRNRLRDALIAYLLQKSEIKAVGLKDTNDLYGYFLIDVEMDACMLTSRLKQAIASAQLFVQRCLLNLEAPTVSPGQIDAKQWEWMKNYRVWEANRQVFLYPENWIEPELRDNKSPFFKELESELLQGEVTNDSVEKALMNYLEKLHDVARLDICGTYEDTEGQELHVFGKTFNTPPQYFYRKLDLKSQVWTPWEKVQLDIQGNEEGDSAGVHLMPVVWNRRLYLFWPVFTEKPDKEKQKEEKEKQKEKQKEEKEKQRRTEKERQDWDTENLPIAQDNAQKRKEIEKQRAQSIWFFTVNGFGQEATTEGVKVKSLSDVNKVYDDMLALLPKIESKPEPYEPEPYDNDTNWTYYEIKLAWSEYKNKKWSNKKVSQSFITTPSNKGEVGPPIYQYKFVLNLGATLTIKMFHQFSVHLPLILDISSILPIGEYQLNCNGRVSVFSNSDSVNFKVINPEKDQVNYYQSVLSAKNIIGIFWHGEKSFALELQNNNGKSSKKILTSSEQEFKLLFPADHDFSDNSSSRFIYQDHKRNYYVEPQKYWEEKVVRSFQSPAKTIIPYLQLQEANPPKVVDKGDPSPFEKVDRFKQLASENISEFVDSGKIAAITGLQLRSMQTLTAPIPMGTKSLSFNSAKVGLNYLGNLDFATTKLQFKPFFHAYVCKFMEALDKNGIEGLLNLYNQQFTDGLIIAGFNIKIGFTNNFGSIYRPNKDNVAEPYPMEDVDFSPAGAYSLYNWELFFHVPMLIANRLSKNQRFEEAMRWYHFVFNPATNDTLNSSARYWQVIPLRNTPQETLDSLFKQLQNPAGDPKRKALEDAITAWRNDPFKPHLIARMRLSAYQKNTVMKYLDNLIAWADNLFRRDTIESINEATQLYILAAELLGRRPEKIPERGIVQAMNYAELEEKGLDAFSNALVKLETIFPYFNLQPVNLGAHGTAPILNTAVQSRYFCLPDNDKLLGYWDTVTDRLFKIRHCQNIEGIERQLALFEPPIDPALLVQAVAGGVDISSVLADLNAPLPHYRFNYILQKALEICAELKSLGNSLLSALEKKDGETLAMMRSNHEALLLDLARTVKKLQITEAQRSREGLEKTRAVTEAKASFYAQVLKEGLNSSEKEHQTLSFASMALSVAGQYLETAASAAHAIPDVEVGAIAGAGGGATNNNRISGGDKAANALSAFGRFFNMLSAMTSFAASSAQSNAGYQRRADEWKLQLDLANKELVQIDKQILASQIREQIADQELTNHKQAIENARQVEDFYRNKFTQEELYGWMMGEISTIYFQCYQLAYDLAKKAEKTYRWELGLPTSNFVQFGVWDSFRKGLMSGERLYLSLKQMEKSYMDQHRREYEITKNISLLQLDALQLITLKETGTCTVELPETLFDMDYPGHYMRRIKTVSLTIPCVVGPYTGVNCTLTLLKSQTRVSAIDAGSYAADLTTDNPRVVTNYSASESIATSSAQNDSGLFEFNFRDERYLPFEGSGAVSSLWRIDLPRPDDFPQFDYETISDVVLHIRYTARQGGKALKEVALKNLKKVLKDKTGKLQSRLFSLRHEFPSEWHRLQKVKEENGDYKQAFSLNIQRFPFMFQGSIVTINTIDVLGVPVGSSVPAMKLTLTSPDGQIVKLQDAMLIGPLVRRSATTTVEVKHLELAGSEADWTIQVKKADVPTSLDILQDILILCQYSVQGH